MRICLVQSTINWAVQLRALVSLPEKCGTYPVWSERSWSKETPFNSLFSYSFFMGPGFFPFFIRCLLLAVTKIHDSQRFTSSFKYISLDGVTPIFSSLNMDLGRRSDNFSCQNLNSCCKGDITSGSMIFSICSCVKLFN